MQLIILVIHYHADGELSSVSDDNQDHIQAKDLYRVPNNYNGDVFH